MDENSSAFGHHQLKSATHFDRVTAVDWSQPPVV